MPSSDLGAIGLDQVGRTSPLSVLCLLPFTVCVALANALMNVFLPCPPNILLTGPLCCWTVKVQTTGLVGMSTLLVEREISGETLEKAVYWLECTIPFSKCNGSWDMAEKPTVELEREIVV